MSRSFVLCWASALCLVSTVATCSAFVAQHPPACRPPERSTVLLASNHRGDVHDNNNSNSNSRLQTALASAVFAAALAVVPAQSLADEYGRETEAPTLLTGETVMICTKRGPLGACLETAQRTAENDNDKAAKYFKDPSDFRKRKEAQQSALAQEVEGSQLIQKLRQQSEDNREKNELAVQMRTMQNDASASFGPFDRQVLIMNADGKGFTLLENPQAMRLKDQGFIKGKQFVTQPTKEEIEAALPPPDGPGILDGIRGLFGGE